AVAEHVAERLVEVVREHRLADGADADRGERDAHLAGGDVLVDPLDLAARERGPLAPLLLELLDAVEPGADQRVLSGDEEAVDGNERRHDDEQQDEIHRATARRWRRLLRGGSSSVIRRTRVTVAEVPGAARLTVCSSRLTVGGLLVDEAAVRRHDEVLA